MMEIRDYTFFDLLTLNQGRFKKLSIKVIEGLEEDSDKFYPFILKYGTKIKVNSDKSNSFIRQSDHFSLP